MINLNTPHDQRPAKEPFDVFLKKVFGSDYDNFMNHPPVGNFVRVNPLRATTQDVLALLQARGFDAEIVQGLSDCIRLRSMPYEPTQCLHHFAGWFVKQSLSSQLPVRFLDAQPGQNIIDLCAAPGSKTTQIAAAMHNEGCLYANDLAGKRMTPLAARLDAALVSHAVLYNMAAERLSHYLPPVFDRVLADVPCSGLGHIDTLDENRDRYETAKNPAAQYQLQYRILVTGARLLKVGGKIVYSTCSLNPEENESVLHEFISRYPFKILDIPDIPGIHFRHGCTHFDGRTFHPDVEKARRVTPWETDTQGFFFAVLQKTDDMPERLSQRAPGAKIIETLSADHPDVAAIHENIQRYYGIDPNVFSKFRFRLKGRENLYCLDHHWTSVIDGFQRAGISLAKRRGGIWRLSHSMIQRFSQDITKNIISLNEAQMREICATGETDVSPSDVCSPYPVLKWEPLGCLASTYDKGNGRIYWKRACAYVI